MTSAYIYSHHPVSGEVQTLGKLTLQGGTGSFVYSPQARAGAVWIPDPITYPVSERPYTVTKNGGVPGFIDDAMPDGWGERVLQRMQKEAITRMDLLMKSPNSDRAGNLTVGRDREPPEGIGQKKLPNLDGLDEFIEACAIIYDSQLDGETLKTLGVRDQRSSVGGARPKRTYQGDRKLILAKPRDRYDVYDLPTFEHACMTFARGKGLQVAKTALHHSDKGNTLLVDRFDRQYVEGRFRRVPMLSALTLFDAEWKSTDHSDWSYARLADELFRRGAPDEDRRELFTRMAYNALVGNGDDHARNHSVIWVDGCWRLSPMYDVLPLLDEGPAQALAMSVGIDGPRLNRDNLLSQREHFALQEAEAAAVLDQVAGWLEELREFYSRFLKGHELDLACAASSAERLLG